MGINKLAKGMGLQDLKLNYHMKQRKTNIPMYNIDEELHEEGGIVLGQQVNGMFGDKVCKVNRKHSRPKVDSSSLIYPK